MPKFTVTVFSSHHGLATAQTDRETVEDAADMAGAALSALSNNPEPGEVLGAIVYVDEEGYDPENPEGDDE